MEFPSDFKEIILLVVVLAKGFFGPTFSFRISRISYLRQNLKRRKLNLKSFPPMYRSECQLVSNNFECLQFNFYANGSNGAADSPCCFANGTFMHFPAIFRCNDCRVLNRFQIGHQAFIYFLQVI